MTLPETIPLLGFRWEDLLFMTLAAVMVGSALLVVTMKDIIRCGLAMIIAFAALAGLYVMAGAPVVAVAMRVRIHAFVGPGYLYYDHVLLLDPSTGQLVGARFVHRLGNDRPSTARDATTRWTWRQAVVPTIRSRPSAS